MTVDFQQLKAAQPERFAAAAKAWQQGATWLNNGGDDFRKRVIDRVFAGDVWDDKAADAGRDHCEGLMRGFGKSYDDLEAIGKALTTAARRIGDAQHLLLKNVNRATEADLDVNPDGRIELPPGDSTKAQAAALETLAYDCAVGISEAIADATTADNDLIGELRERSLPLPSLKQLNAASDRVGHQGLEAAKLAEELLRQGSGALTAEELRRLHRLMRNADDPAFSTQFLEELGPEAGLRLNVLLAKAGNSDRTGVFGLGKSLQEDLAQALASATDKTAGQHLSYVPHTAEEQANDTSWIDQLQDAGRTPMGSFGREGSLDMHGISGYHALAALLDDAEFSSDFLNEVGQDMYHYDVTENPDDWSRASVRAGKSDDRGATGLGHQPCGVPGDGPPRPGGRTPALPEAAHPGPHRGQRMLADQGHQEPVEQVARCQRPGEVAPRQPHPVTRVEAVEVRVPGRFHRRVVHHRLGVVPDAVTALDGPPGEVGLLVRVEEPRRKLPHQVEHRAADGARPAEEGGHLAGAHRVARAQAWHVATRRRGSVRIADPKRQHSQPRVAAERVAHVRGEAA